MSTFQDRSINVNIIPYSLNIPFSKWDALDDQIGDLREHVQIAVKRYAQLPDVLIAEYLNGVPDLNPSLLKAYDGADLISAVDGDGNNRLSVAGGNIITGSGLTVSGVIHDIAMAQQRFLNFKDPTAGKPIYSAEDVAFTKLHVIGPNAANEVLQKASKSEYIKLDIANNTSESNYIKGEFTYHINPYLTDSSDLYVVTEHDYWKAFVFRRGGIDSIFADESNSDHARNTAEFALYSSLRCRLGVMMPGTIIKINN